MDWEGVRVGRVRGGGRAEVGGLSISETAWRTVEADSRVLDGLLVEERVDGFEYLRVEKGEIDGAKRWP